MLRLVIGMCGLFLFLPQTASAQVPASEGVVFFSTDGVELVGTFHPGKLGPRAPSVLLLHKVGGSRKDPGWQELAQSLQKKGFSVLSFDFRGHGESTSVSADFWLHASHRSIKGAGALPAKISHEDFTRPVHFAELANDIAAARYALELKAREGACDAGTIILVGAESGASLGALWVATEWQRWRTANDGTGKRVKQGQEGHDIACAVWLSISPVLTARQPVPVEAWLGGTVRERVPMGFLYGAKDTRSGEFSRGLFEKLKQVGGDGVNKLTGTKGFTDSEGTGSALLIADDLGAVGVIGTYLDLVLKERKKVVRARADTETLPPLILPELFGIR